MFFLSVRGGATQATVIRQVGDFNCIEILGGSTGGGGGGVKGIHITGESLNGLTNTAIYVLRTSTLLHDISISSYRGTAINMTGSIPGGTGCWFSRLNEIKIVGVVQNGIYYTDKGIILGDNFNSAFLTDFTVHYCKTASIETGIVNDIAVYDGNLSENKDVNSRAVNMLGAGTNVKFANIHLEGNTNGFYIAAGNMIVLDNIISNGYGLQTGLVDIPTGSTAQNIYLYNCSSFGSTIADVRVNNYKTYALNLINCSLRSATPIQNINNSEIVITSYGVTKKDTNSLEPMAVSPSAIVATDTTLLKKQTGNAIVVSSATPVTLTLPAYFQGIRYTIINTRTSGVVNIASSLFQNFGTDTGLVTTSLQITGLGTLELYSLSDRWVVLNQRGPWVKF